MQKVYLKGRIYTEIIDQRKKETIREPNQRAITNLDQKVEI